MNEKVKMTEQTEIAEGKSGSNRSDVLVELMQPTSEQRDYLDKLQRDSSCYDRTVTVGGPWKGSEG